MGFYFLIADMKVFLPLLPSAAEEKNKWEQKGRESEPVALIKLLLELQVLLELLDLFTAANRKKKEKPNIKRPQFLYHVHEKKKRKKKETQK